MTLFSEVFNFVTRISVDESHKNLNLEQRVPSLWQYVV